MATIEQRLKVLESKSTLNKDKVTEIFLVGFVDPDELNSPINHIWHGADNFYMADDESEDNFKNRVCEEIRKIYPEKAKGVLLLFADRSSKNILS